MLTSSEAKESFPETPVPPHSFFHGNVRLLQVDPKTNTITGTGSEVEVFKGTPVREYVTLKDAKGNLVDNCMELYTPY